MSTFTEAPVSFTIFSTSTAHSSTPSFLAETLGWAASFMMSFANALTFSPTYFSNLGLTNFASSRSGASHRN